MKTIYYAPPVLALVIAAAWLTNQKTSEPKKTGENVSPDKPTNRSRPLADQANQPAMSQQRSRATRKPAATEDPSIVLNDIKKRAALSDDELAELAARWLQIDPPAAIAWIHSLPNTHEFGYFIADIAAKAMKHDESATFAWVEALPEGRKKDLCIETLTGLLLTGVQSQGALEARMATLPPAWHDWVKVQWVKDGHVSQELAEELTKIYQRDPQKIFSVPGKMAWERLLNSYQKNGNYNDGMAWAMAMPDEKSQAYHVLDLTRKWVRVDPGAVVKAANDMPQGPVRDAAAKSLIGVLRGNDPASAFAWAQSISNEKDRREQTRGVYDAWLDNDPLEASKAIQSFSLEERKQIFGKEK